MRRPVPTCRRPGQVHAAHVAGAQLGDARSAPGASVKASSMSPIAVVRLEGVGRRSLPRRPSRSPAARSRRRWWRRRSARSRCVVAAAGLTPRFPVMAEAAPWRSRSWRGWRSRRRSQAHREPEPRPTRCRSSRRSSWPWLRPRPPGARGDGRRVGAIAVEGAAGQNTT